jgi:hypothetical protein
MESLVGGYSLVVIRWWLFVGGYSLVVIRWWLFVGGYSLAVHHQHPSPANNHQLSTNNQK